MTGGGIPQQTDLISHLLHSNDQGAASNKATWSYVSMKDANRPYEQTGAIEEIFEHESNHARCRSASSRIGDTDHVMGRSPQRSEAERRTRTRCSPTTPAPTRLMLSRFSTGQRRYVKDDRLRICCPVGIERSRIQPVPSKKMPSKKANYQEPYRQPARTY